MKKILIVEDTLISAYLLETSLKDDYIINIVDNGFDAINEINNNHYDIILLDVIMPDMSGFDLMKYLQEKKLNLNIIVITSLSDLNAKLKAYDLGAHFFLSKPVDYGFVKKIVAESIVTVN